jgi:hypothetical protein
MKPSCFDEVIDFQHLVRAARIASRGKRNRAAMASLLFHLETEILQLQRELQDRTYRPQPYRTFTISDPKPRAISAAAPRDRLVHHALCAALEPLLEAQAVPQSYACRPGKGSHAAVARARALARRWPYFLKLDVRKYFETVSHPVLKIALRGVIDDPAILWLADLFIDHGAPGSPIGRGLPIGNLTSQHFANFYLSGLDRFALGLPGVGGYVRYMDDLLLFAGDKSTLKMCSAQVEGYLAERLALELKSEARVLAPVSEGVPFLGFRVFPGTVRLDGRARRRLIARLRQAEADLVDGAQEQAVADSVRSAMAHVAHGNTLALRRSLVQPRSEGAGASQARTG